MIETTKIWEYSPSAYDIGFAASRELRKKHGSKRSGTVYLVADSKGEAQEIIRDMFRQAGFAPPEHPEVGESHLVMKALRMVY